MDSDERSSSCDWLFSLVGYNEKYRPEVGESVPPVRHGILAVLLWHLDRMGGVPSKGGGGRYVGCNGPSARSWLDDAGLALWPVNDERWQRGRGGLDFPGVPVRPREEGES